ncbi:hypothetical protein ROZALSC1DRAFT_30564 [Rozella allomycis CSF55]|uniref:Uncharacterized protein n=1 Tax=Rozella allomycis (strain CSF55) TaxID=988480 RepID=A0A075APC5_ROZAC|nr:hypothetical protein O9G_005447 [Rozella allomycis CSF55]RKP17664.1 hypothetical protein ROZALSC1DRAFT_30564 [Rozella allomycis CSF55]|eukprot:EPZ31916.1 hypothetical protein O9G_005447 [Rozella allomycis CSF55]
MRIGFESSLSPDKTKTETLLKKDLNLILPAHFHANKAFPTEWAIDKPDIVLWIGNTYQDFGQNIRTTKTKLDKTKDVVRKEQKDAR